MWLPRCLFSLHAHIVSVANVSNCLSWTSQRIHIPCTLDLSSIYFSVQVLAQLFLVNKHKLYQLRPREVFAFALFTGSGEETQLCHYRWQPCLSPHAAVTPRSCDARLWFSPETPKPKEAPESTRGPGLCREPGLTCVQFPERSGMEPGNVHLNKPQGMLVLG